MGQRIRQLEDALAIFQAGVSNEPHPLLREDLLAIKFGPERRYAPETVNNPSQSTTESIDALGTMTIGDQGDGGKYFGPSAGSEVSFFSSVSFRALTLPQTLFLVSQIQLIYSPGSS